MNIDQFKHARFGVFRPDGRFEELPADTGEAMEDPQHMEARWVGGTHDMQLLNAALSAVPALPEQAAPEAAWISVEERLPEDGIWIVMSDGDGRYHLGRANFRLGFLRCVNTSNGKFVTGWRYWAALPGGHDPSLRKGGRT